MFIAVIDPVVAENEAQTWSAIIGTFSRVSLELSVGSQRVKVIRAGQKNEPTAHANAQVNRY